jgi:hypothetical protein
MMDANEIRAYLIGEIKLFRKQNKGVSKLPLNLVTTNTNVFMFSNKNDDRLKWSSSIKQFQYPL